MIKIALSFILLLQISNAQKTVVIGCGYNEPTATFLTTTLKAIFKEVKIPLEILLFPMKRSILNASQGVTDGDSARVFGINKYFPTLKRVNTSIYEMDIIALSHKQHKIEKLDDLKKYNIGLVRGMKIVEVAIDKLECKSLIKVDSHKQLIGLLAKNRIDVALVDKEASFSLLKQYENKGIYFNEKTIMVEPLYLHLHKKNNFLIPKLNKAIKDLYKKGVLQKIKKDFYMKLKSKDISSQK